MNLDTSRPSYSSLDDTYMPTMEGKNDINEDLNIPSRKNTVTYDELRQKNRDEYMKNQPSSYYRYVRIFIQNVFNGLNLLEILEKD